MTALIIALAAAVVGVLVIVAVGQRRRVLSSPRRTDGADELRRTQLELRWARQLSALSETLDLDELLSPACSRAPRSFANGDASAVALWGKGKPPIVKAMNLTSDEALPLLGSWPAGRAARERSPFDTGSRARLSPPTRSSSASSSRSRRNRALRPGPWGSSRRRAARRARRRDPRDARGTRPRRGQGDG